MTARPVADSGIAARVLHAAMEKERMRVDSRIAPQYNQGAAPWPALSPEKMPHVGICMNKKISGGVAHELPADLRKALASDPKALAAWEDITQLARNEWIWARTLSGPQ
jgi:hypothetical protein